MTSRKSSTFWSTILETLLRPEATTRMSTRPNLSTAALTTLSQFSSELGRTAMISVLAPSFSHSAATFFSSSALLAARTTLAPAPARVFAASAPKAPDAPATIAVLPLISNNDSGFLRNDSDIISSRYFCQGRGCPRPSGQDHQLKPRDDGPKGRHFGGFATATTIEQTSLPRLMISRVSFGSITQESFALSTVSLPLTMMVNSPRRTK